MGVFKIIVVVLLWAFTCYASEPVNSVHSDSTQTIELDSPQDSLKLGRLALVASATTVSYAGSWYLIFKNTWWDSSGTKFKFKTDFEYAKNVDKFGHFYSGIWISEGFYDGLRWSGVSEFKSHLWAGIFSSVTHIGVDIKDGYTYWGYSMWDVVAGTLGGFWPMGKRYIPWMRFVDYKMSYWVNSDAYWTQPGDHAFVFTDDYCNQTHWLSFKINAMLPNVVEPYWPDWLNLAAGVSVDDRIFRKQVSAAKRQIYIGLDYDLQELKPQAYWAKRLVTYLNYIKLPAPSVRVYPDYEFQLIYPLEF